VHCCACAFDLLLLYRIVHGGCAMHACAKFACVQMQVDAGDAQATAW
jgi:hypothetical protein